MPVFTPCPSVLLVVTPSTTELWQVNCTWLSTRERQRWVAEQLCLYCAGPGYFLTNCRKRRKRPSIIDGMLTGASMDSTSSTSRSKMHAVVSSMGSDQLQSQCQLHVPYLGQLIEDTHFSSDNSSLNQRTHWCSPRWSGRHHCSRGNLGLQKPLWRGFLLHHEVGSSSCDIGQTLAPMPPPTYWLGPRNYYRLEP